MRGLICALLMGASGLYATSCGTVFAPTACGVTINSVTYTVSALNFAATAGTKLYQEGDMNVDINDVGGSMVLTFSINTSGPSGNASFFVNGPDTANITLAYTMAITPDAPGTVAFISPVRLTLGPDSQAGDAFGHVQFASNGGEGGCVAQLVIESSEDCDLSGSVGTSVDAGNILTLNGGTGNIAILSFTNTWNASFTADSGNGVPEPSTFALLGLGLAALPVARRFARRRP